MNRTEIERQEEMVMGSIWMGGLATATFNIIILMTIKAVGIACSNILGQPHMLAIPSVLTSVRTIRRELRYGALTPEA